MTNNDINQTPVYLFWLAVLIGICTYFNLHSIKVNVHNITTFDMSRETIFMNGVAPLYRVFYGKKQGYPDYQDVFFKELHKKNIPEKGDSSHKRTNKELTQKQVFEIFVRDLMSKLPLKTPPDNYELNKFIPRDKEELNFIIKNYCEKLDLQCKKYTPVRLTTQELDNYPFVEK